VFPVSGQPFYVISSRRNRWLVILRARTRKEKQSPTLKHATFVCLAQFREGIYAFAGTDMLRENSREKSGLLVFRPHFFARYRLRYQLKETGLHLIGKYFKENYTFYQDFQQVYADNEPLIGRKVFATSEEGVALGEIRSNTAILIRTYISYDMMYDEQIPEFTQREILRKQRMVRYQSGIAKSAPKKTDENEWFNFVVEVLFSEIEGEIDKEIDGELADMVVRYTERFFRANRGNNDVGTLSHYIAEMSRTVYRYQQQKIPEHLLLAMTALGNELWKPAWYKKIERFYQRLLEMSMQSNGINGSAWKSLEAYKKVYSLSDTNIKQIKK
jgi:hypothetical protein